MTLRNQNKTKTVVIFVLLIVICFLIYKNYFTKVFNFTNDPTSQTDLKDATPEVKPTLEKITMSTKKFKEETASSIIDITYPQISGLSNKSSSDTINRFIKSETVSMQKAFFVDLSDELFGDAKNEFDIDEPGAYIALNFVNSKMTVLEFASGSAHPNHYVKAYVFDSKDGHAVKLSEIFTDKNNYLNIISKQADPYVAKYLKSKEFDYDYSAGLKPTEQNFSEYTFEQNGLKFYFNPYQVAPYVVGTVEILIPWSDLNKYLDTNFAKTLKNFQ